MLTIIQAETDKYKSHIQELFWEYFQEIKVLFSQEFNLDLDVDTFSQYYMAQLNQFNPPTGRLFLAEYDGEIVGCVCLRKIDIDIGEVKRMYVKPNFRKQGIGRVLLVNLINETTNIGYSKIRLDSPPFAKTAHTLYRSLGFQDIEPYIEKVEIPLEYRANWVFMELILKP